MENPQLVETVPHNDFQWLGAICYRDSHGQEFGLNEINSCFTETAPNSPLRCVDGRPPDETNGSIGPQLPGGSFGIILGYRLAGLGRLESTQYSFLSDATSINAHLVESCITLGGHRDNHHPDGYTGCGAIDKMPDIIKVMNNSKLSLDIKIIVESLCAQLEVPFNEATYQEILTHARSLENDSNYYANRGAALDDIEKDNPNSVVTLSGAHQESYVVINFIEDTTLDSGKLFEQTKVQAFGFDIWKCKKLAEQLFDNNTARDKFIMAMILYTTATLITLTDGSLKILHRIQPDNQ